MATAPGPVDAWFEVVGTGVLIEYNEMQGGGNATNAVTNVHLDGTAMTSAFVAYNNMHDFNGDGIYAGNGNPASDIAIFGNTLLNFAGTTGQPLNGIQLNSCTNGLGNCTSGFYLAKNSITVGPTGIVFTAFTIHGDIQNSVVAYNTVDHPCGIGPTNTAVVENPNTALFEGNVSDWPASNVGDVAIVIDAPKVEVRNNLILNADTAIAIGGGGFNLLPPNFVDEVFVENNTAYQNPPAGQPLFYAVYLATHSNTTGSATFLNNIFWEGMMNFSSGVVGVDGMGIETIDYNEMYAPNAAMITTPNVGAHGVMADPMFITAPADSNANPITPSMFFLQSSSPGVNTGTNTGAFEDFYGVARPQQGAWDMGAFEHVP